MKSHNYSLFKKSQRNINVYDYTFVCVNQNELITYPIFLEFTDSSVDFYMHLENGTFFFSGLLFQIPLLENDNQLTKEVLESIFKAEITGHFQQSQDTFSRYNSRHIFSKNTITKSRIFLDFLFDLIHKDVFSEWRKIKEVRQTLLGNFFTNSIICKNNLLFSREAYKKNSPDSFPLIISQRLFDDEKKWLSILLDERANYFCFTNWFRPVEIEMEEVLFSENFNRADWQKKHFSTSIEDTKKNSLESNKLEKERNDIFDFYLKRYDFNSVFRYIKSYHPIFGSLVVSIISPLIMLLATLLLIILIILYPSNIVFLILSSSGIIFPFFSTIFLLFFINSFIQFFKGKNNFPLIFHIKVMAPKMLISILAGWLTLFPFSEELWEWNTFYEFNMISWCFFIFILIFVVITTIFYEVKSAEPIQDFQKTWLKVARVYFIGFYFSIGLGTLILHLSSSYIYDNTEAIPTTIETLNFHEELKQIGEAPNYLTLISLSLDTILYSNSSGNIIQDKIEGFHRLRNDIIFNNHFENSRRESNILTQFDSLNNSKTASSFNLTKVSLKNGLREYSDNVKIKIPKAKRDAAKEMAIKICKNHRFPVIAYNETFEIFIFPRLLILNSLIAFIIGFILQFIMEAKVFKEKI